MKQYRLACDGMDDDSSISSRVVPGPRIPATHTHRALLLAGRTSTRAVRRSDHPFEVQGGSGLPRPTRSAE